MTLFNFDEVAKIRRFGCVTGGFTNVVPEVSDFDNLNRASLVANAFQIGDEWIPISRDELLTDLARLIGYDSAYRTLVIPAELASHFATNFAGVFLEDARFYKNFEKEHDASGRYVRGYSTPLTDATFSHGFAGIDSQHLGMIIISDED